MNRLHATEPITDIIQDTFLMKTWLASPRVRLNLIRNSTLLWNEKLGQKQKEQIPEWKRREQKNRDQDCILSRLGVTLNWGFLVSLKLWIQKVGTIIFPLWKLNGMPHADQEAREQPLPCPQCEKRYKTRKYLAEHIRGVHVREVRFACGICGKGFFWPTDFKSISSARCLASPQILPSPLYQLLSFLLVIWVTNKNSKRRLRLKTMSGHSGVQMQSVGGLNRRRGLWVNTFRGSPTWDKMDLGKMWQRLPFLRCLLLSPKAQDSLCPKRGCSSTNDHPSRPVSYLLPLVGCKNQKINEAFIRILSISQNQLCARLWSLTSKPWLAWETSVILRYIDKIYSSPARD